MMTLPPPFTFGQTVWIAWCCAYCPRTVPCPVCYGKRSVVLILGNGEHQPIECDYCSPGLQRPSGTVTEHGVDAKVYSSKVTGMSQSGNKWRVECNGSYVEPTDVFDTKEAAVARLVVMQAAAEEQAKANFESQFKVGRKKVSWAVGYHRNQLKDLRRKAEFHKGKLREYKEKKSE